MADFHTDLVVGEVKSRANLPKWLTDAMNQVRSYNLMGNRLPILCLKERGMRGFLVVIHSSDFEAYFGDLIDKEG